VTLGDFYKSLLFGGLASQRYGTEALREILKFQIHYPTTRDEPADLRAKHQGRSFLARTSCLP